MAIIQQCDRCKRTSPENGVDLHEDWFEIHIVDREAKSDIQKLITNDEHFLTRILLCRECCSIIKSVMKNSTSIIPAPES